MKRLILFLILIAGFTPHAARAQEDITLPPHAIYENMDGLIFKDEIVITTREDGYKVTADLYRADNNEKLPGLIIAHGGGFVAGSKDAFGIPEVSQFFARHGFVVLAVDYRLLQDGGLFPKNAQDVKCSIQWLRAHAAEYNVDTGRMIIQGNSAGGYMASFASVTQHNDTFNASCGDPALDAQKPEVDFMAAWYGVHDFTTMTHNLVRTMELSYFRKVKDIPAFKKEISPITYADQAPPMLLLHGTADQLVPFDQSVSMCKAVNAAGGDCTLIEFPGYDHGFVGEKLGTEGADKALTDTLKWLRARLADFKPAARSEAPGIKEYAGALCAQMQKDPLKMILGNVSFEMLEALVVHLDLAGKEGIPDKGIKEFLRQEIEKEFGAEDVKVSRCTVTRAEPVDCGQGLDMLMHAEKGLEAFDGSRFMPEYSGELRLQACGFIEMDIVGAAGESFHTPPTMAMLMNGAWKLLYLN